RTGIVARWSLYLRQVKQVLRTADESFDERRYGFSGLVEALRYAQREGLFRLDRDRQGVLRVYPGARLQRVATTTAAAPGYEAPAEVSQGPSASSEPEAGDLFGTSPVSAGDAGASEPVVETSGVDAGAAASDASESAVSEPETE